MAGVTNGTLRDSDIRQALRASLLSLHNDDTVIVDEMGLSAHTARVDVAVLNGCFAGFEIKSDVDKLDRLQAQISAYDSVIDYMTIVTGSRFAASAASHIPPHWGIITAKATRHGVVLVNRRKPRQNTAFNKRSLAMMLWRDELVAALKARDAYHGLSRLPKGALWDRLADISTVNELRSLVLESIKRRGDWRAASTPT